MERESLRLSLIKSKRGKILMKRRIRCKILFCVFVLFNERSLIKKKRTIYVCRRKKEFIGSSKSRVLSSVYFIEKKENKKKKIEKEKERQHLFANAYRKRQMELCFIIS